MAIMTGGVGGAGGAGKTKEKCSEGLEEKEEEDPRDRGWAWVVALAVGLLNILLQGSLKIFGLLYMEWLVLYQGSPTATSWVGSLFALTVTVMSPLVGNASDHFSARTARIVVFVCGILLSLCFCVAGWMQSLLGVMIVFGFIGGVLVAVVDTPILSLLSRYFFRKRSTASGIAFSCSSLGGLVLPLGIARANEEYGVRGALMIFGGLWLNLLVISAAMIPLPKVVIASKKFRKSTSVEDTVRSGKPADLLNGKASQDKPKSEKEGAIAENKQPAEVIDKKAPQVKLLRIRNLGEANSYTSQSQSGDELSSKPARHLPLGEVSHSESEEGVKCEEKTTPEQLADDVKLSMNGNQSQLSDVTTHREDHTEQASSNVCLSGVCNYIKFLRTPHLPSFLVASFFGSFAYYSQFFIIPPLAVEMGMSKIMASNIIAIISVSELLGRIGIGFLADRLGQKKIWITILSTICSLIIGLLVAFNLSETALIGFAPFFGVFGGLFTPLIIPVTMDLVPPDRLGSAAGLFPLITGGGITLGMPVLSAVYEMTSSYKTGFLICICGNAITAFFLFVHVAGRYLKCRKNASVEPVL
ncbi:hypothetical protein CAPTEDRAFT_191771 [Capitella teleta]|uniref:Major facilitator superfamily (MFS) profile domain-containing protein n=1 Tax=Capitella teleta TaxID=283909 RepID=R7TIG1_CAPTE|nr:hypothetical protein CAPTEDRAFT_191771 [Capitella teleta]|eukprot:ELT93633.1 hypothetical protein CAPTEDRAFT_191771 [Capitella teleta]